jgi:hypothetical protein
MMTPFEAWHTVNPEAESLVVVMMSVALKVVPITGESHRDSVQQCTYAVEPATLPIVAPKLDQGCERRVNGNMAVEPTVTPSPAATTLGTAFAMLPA